MRNKIFNNRFERVLVEKKKKDLSHLRRKWRNYYCFILNTRRDSKVLWENCFFTAKSFMDCRIISEKFQSIDNYQRKQFPRLLDDIMPAVHERYDNMKRSYWRGVVYCFLWYTSIFCGWLLLCLPTLPLLLIDLRIYRKAIDLVFRMWEIYPVALMEMLFSTEFVISGDEIRPWERSLFVMNHRTRLDWNFLWGAMHYGTTTPAHRLKLVLKSAIRHIPGPGWVMQMAGFFFIDRKWERDQDLLNQMIGYMEELDYTYQILIFPEGTDLTERNLNKSHSYADKLGLDRYYKVLHPKTTGFTHLANRMRMGNRLDAIYDLTVGYPDIVPEIESQVFRGRFPERVHFNIKRHDVAELPNDQEGVKDWLNALWKDKERKLTSFYEPPSPEDRHFDDPKVKLNQWPRPLSNAVLLAAIFWTGIVLFCMSLLYLYSWFRWYVCITSVAFGILSFSTEGLFYFEIMRSHLKSTSVKLSQNTNGNVNNERTKID